MPEAMPAGRQELSDLLKVRREKLEEFKKAGINPYPYKYERTIFSADILKKFEAIKDLR